MSNIKRVLVDPIVDMYLNEKKSDYEISRILDTDIGGVIAITEVLDRSQNATFYDNIGLRSFKSSISEIAALTERLSSYLESRKVSLNEFYKGLGLDPLDIGENIGFDKDHPVFVSFKRMDDGVKMMLINCVFIN